MYIDTEAKQKLVAYVDRLERLSDEVDGLKADLGAVRAEAKAEGYNVRALVKLVEIRRNKKKALGESELLNDLLLYAHATGTELDVAVEERR